MYGLTVFDPLTAVTTSGQVVPYLAQSVTPNGDFTSWTITMRPNVDFHDGTPCDGAALYTNLKKQSTSILTGAVFAQSIKDVTQTGPLSVRVDMTEPWTTFPFYTSSVSQVGYVAAPSMLNDPNGTLHPVGTGPFKSSRSGIPTTTSPRSATPTTGARVTPSWTDHLQADR